MKYTIVLALFLFTSCAHDYYYWPNVKVAIKKTGDQEKFNKSSVKFMKGKQAFATYIPSENEDITEEQLELARIYVKSSKSFCKFVADSNGFDEGVCDSPVFDKRSDLLKWMKNNPNSIFATILTSNEASQKYVPLQLHSYEAPSNSKTTGTIRSNDTRYNVVLNTRSTKTKYYTTGGYYKPNQCLYVIQSYYETREFGAQKNSVRPFFKSSAGTCRDESNVEWTIPWLVNATASVAYGRHVLNFPVVCESSQGRVCRTHYPEKKMLIFNDMDKWKKSHCFHNYELVPYCHRNNGLAH